MFIRFLSGDVKVKAGGVSAGERYRDINSEVLSIELC